MKTSSRNITLAQRGMAVLIPVLIALAAVLWTSTARAQTAADSSATQNPCRGLPSLTMIINAATLTSNGTLTKEVASPSGRCSMGLTVTADSSSPSQAPNPSASCTITAAPVPLTTGVRVVPTFAGDCALAKVSARVSIDPGPSVIAGPTGAAATPGSGRGTRVVHARLSVDAGSAAIFALRMKHSARGKWWYNNSVVTLVRVTYRTHLDDHPSWDMRVGSDQKQVHWSENRARVQAYQDIGWYQRNHDFEPGWLTTRVKVIMKAQGLYDCDYAVWGSVIRHPGSVRLNDWECFY